MMPLFIAGLGMGSAIIALFQQSMMMIESKDSGTASGSMQSLQHIAMAVGIGIVGQLFFISLDISTNAQFAFKYCIYFSTGIYLPHKQKNYFKAASFRRKHFRKRKGGIKYKKPC